ncbi:MAG: hypothetical protein Q7U47_13820 [Paludibacter sp.]|nr:hypothetical protein [Paludibacter sp.]
MQRIRTDWGAVVGSNFVFREDGQVSKLASSTYYHPDVEVYRLDGGISNTLEFTA